MRAPGSEFQLAVMMRISMNPRKMSGASGASTPPATITSSTPACMLR